MSVHPRQLVVAALAVGLTAFVLAAMSLYTIFSIRPTGQDAYFKRVETVIESLPRHIGRFQGVDQPPLPASIELLRPNKLLQRRYEDALSGEGFSILIVHCGDVRDMQGHYPPECYPSSGWTVEETTPETIERSTGGPIPITRYVVSRGEEPDRNVRVIANTFVVPRADSPLGRDDSILDRVTRTRWSSGLGAAQVQIITEAQMDPQTRREIERTVAEKLQGLIDAVASPRVGEGEPT
ncbi:hypothetical protein AY599_18795 [Leptolyngbya valderiana BDU 20041]|nr:hypothetical protein AY599_18795 [Leptolyngbya valderiana BDU 20041]